MRNNSVAEDADVDAGDVLEQVQLQLVGRKLTLFDCKWIDH